MVESPALDQATSEVLRDLEQGAVIVRSDRYAARGLSLLLVAGILLVWLTLVN